MAVELYKALENLGQSALLPKPGIFVLQPLTNSVHLKITNIAAEFY
jgi:hypothetical protein